jgi:hypothetical protein
MVLMGGANRIVHRGALDRVELHCHHPFETIS